MSPLYFSPMSPAMELHKIKREEYTPVSFTCDHFIRMKIGLSSIPPPIPIIPESNPRTAPIKTDNRIDGGGFISYSLDGRYNKRSNASNKRIPRINL